MAQFCKSRRLALAACAALLSAAPLAAQAATTTATFTVTASVASTCSVESNNLHFGAYSGAQLDSTSGLQVVCSIGVPYSVGLSAGSLSERTVSNRGMAGPGSEVLNYSLSQDASHSINWGDTVGTDTVAGTGNGAAQNLTVFGRVAAGQFIAPGSYADTVTVTLTF